MDRRQLWESRIYLATADEQNEFQQSVLALDRDSGDLLWETTATPGQLLAHGSRTRVHKPTEQSPATENDVYIAFLNGGNVNATALESRMETSSGRLRWVPIARSTVTPLRRCFFESLLVLRWRQ